MRTLIPKKTGTDNDVLVKVLRNYTDLYALFLKDLFNNIVTKRNFLVKLTLADMFPIFEIETLLNKEKYITISVSANCFQDF